MAGNLYRLLVLKLIPVEKATPETLWLDFLDAAGILHVTGDGVTCALNTCAATTPPSWTPGSPTC